MFIQLYVGITIRKFCKLILLSLVEYPGYDRKFPEFH